MRGFMEYSLNRPIKTITNPNITMPFSTKDSFFSFKSRRVLVMPFLTTVIPTKENGKITQLTEMAPILDMKIKLSTKGSLRAGRNKEKENYSRTLTKSSHTKDSSRIMKFMDMEPFSTKINPNMKGSLKTDIRKALVFIEPKTWSMKAPLKKV